MYLYGASGHGKVVKEIAESMHIFIKAFIDDNRQLKDLLGLPVLHEIPENASKLVVSIGNNQVRKSIAEKLSKCDYPVLLHAKANVSKSAILNEGSVVMAGATINASCIIGKHVIINTNASVDHDCYIEDYVHISPNVALSGTVSVGEGTHIGTGTCVIPNVKIGKWAIIGAGSVVINDIPDFSVVVGNPAQVIKYNPIFE